jgi:DNA-binding transcriptional LysR family regulator
LILWKFKAVVDCGGVTRAAAQLHRVLSNVTTRLKQLEEGLGTKLFHRHSRKLLLSTDGKLLLTYADRLLRLSGEAEWGQVNCWPSQDYRYAAAPLLTCPF